MRYERLCSAVQHMQWFDPHAAVHSPCSRCTCFSALSCEQVHLSS
jgi:hypothetical protein